MLLIIESTVLTVFNNKKGVAFHKGDTDYPTACHKENVRKYHMKSGVNRAKSPVYTALFIDLHRRENVILLLLQNK